MKHSRPTVESSFVVDLDWWEENKRSFRLELWSHLCPECRRNFPSHRDTELIDWVDPQTAEVRRVDGLWHSLQTCCANKPGFSSHETSLVTAVFRLYLSNGNNPMSPIEIWQRLARRDPETILRLLLFGRSYYGIRPQRDN